MQIERTDMPLKIVKDYVEDVEQQEICRLCGKRSKNYVAIFEENNLYIAEKISRCLPIIVLSTDKLPSYICKQCLLYLNISYKLIITSLEVDTLLRNQLVESKKMIFTENQNMRKLCEETFKETDSRNSKNLSLKELKKRAIAGPAECEFCKMGFEDIDTFDYHMETVHLLDWRCNMCDNSFETSTELISHKTLNHGGNIVICKTCICVKKNRELKNQLEIEIGKSKSDLLSTVEETTNKLQTVVNIESKKSINVTEEAIHEGSSENKIFHTNPNISCSFRKLKCPKGKNGSMLLCDFCKIYFGDEHHFTAHKKIHDPKHITCTTCHTECSSIYDLFRHKRTEHNMYKKVQLKYVCEKCGKFFTNSWQWESHKGNICPKNMSDNTCKYCRSIFSTSHKLMRHLRKHKSEMFNDPSVTVYKCVACPKVFVDKEFYQKHRNVHDPECWDKFKCDICNRPFRDNVRLREHQLSIHEGIKLHQCDICGRTFYRLYNMKVHRATHFGCKCNHCDLLFGKMRDLAKHIKDDHGLEPDIKKLSPKTTYISSIYVCRYCGKKLASYQSLISHEYIHTGEKPYNCKICHKTFRSCTSRWAHTQRHKKGNFVCEHCGKCFSYKQNLTVHVQTHLPIEDRKHQCSKCGKRFLRKCHLNVHMRIHDGIRPYTCDICLFSFTQKGDMRRHRLRHLKGDVQIRSPRSKHVLAKIENSS